MFCRSQRATKHIFTKERNCRPALDSLNSWRTFHPPTSTNTPTLLGLPKSRAIHLLMLILPTIYFIRECKIKGWALWERDALRQELKIRRLCQHSFFGKSYPIQLKLVENEMKAWWVWHFTHRIIMLRTPFEYLPSVSISGRSNC